MLFDVAPVFCDQFLVYGRAIPLVHLLTSSYTSIAVRSFPSKEL